MPGSPQLEAAFDWLVDGAPGAATPMAVLERLMPELVGAGIPVDRAVALVRTLHPHFMGRRFLWEPGKQVVVEEASWAVLHSREFVGSPAAVIFETGQELRRRLTEPTGFPALEALKPQGYTDFLGLPFHFMGGSVHCITFATRAEGGFTEEQLAGLRRVCRPLSRVAETLALMRTAANLLNAYVGRDAGERILKGHVQRGDTENIRCIIWFSDLRGFTTLSGDRQPREIIAVLNEFFDCQVPALERHGGEVLKFIGDGLLAIFPLSGAQDVGEAGRRAVLAAEGAFAALERLNATRAGRQEGALQFGVALHVGEVAYGNIGGAGRLDFTAIGPAVNLASRLEGLAGKLGKALLLSEELATQTGLAVRSLGTFELKGVARPQAVYELARPG